MGAVSERVRRAVVPTAPVADACQEEVPSPFRSLANGGGGFAGCFFIERQNCKRGGAHPSGGARHPRPAREPLVVRLGVAEKPLARAISERGFGSGVPQQPPNGALVRVLAQALGRRQSGECGHPCAMADSHLRRPASVGPLSGAQPLDSAPSSRLLTGRPQCQKGVAGRLRPRRTFGVGPPAIGVLPVNEQCDGHESNDAGGSRAGAAGV